MTISNHSSAAMRHFSGTYVEARAKFLEAARARGASIAVSYTHLTLPTTPYV